MGDATTPLTPADARHLLRRTGFGALPKEVAKIQGLSRGAAVDDLLDFVPESFELQGEDLVDLHNTWLRYLMRPRPIRRSGESTNVPWARHALQEKLVLFWHDHFATDATKIGYVPAVVQQNLLLRQHCKGNFKAFVKAVNKNPLMMAFLDTIRNFDFQPNENYAREFMELFTLGLTDFAGNPNYTQGDIVQIARAFSGWRLDLSSLTAFLADKSGCDTDVHDYAACYPARGPKVIFRGPGGFGPEGRSFTINGEGAAEIDTVTDIIFEHRDTDNKNTVSRFIAYKLFTYFAHPDPDLAVIDQLVAQSGFDASFDVQSLLRAMFVHDAFFASSARPSADTPRSVKWPIDFVVSTLRLLRLLPKGISAELSGGGLPFRASLANMGQILLQPPSVFGWDWEEAWLASSRLVARFSFATAVIASRRGGIRTRLHAAALINQHLTDPGDIVDAVTDLLGVTDQLNSSERQVLIDYLGGPLDLHNLHLRNIKLNGLIGLVLASPAYQFH